MGLASQLAAPEPAPSERLSSFKPDKRQENPSLMHNSSPEAGRELQRQALGKIFGSVLTETEGNTMKIWYDARESAERHFSLWPWSLHKPLQPALWAPALCTGKICVVCFLDTNKVLFLFSNYYHINKITPSTVIVS